MIRKHFINVKNDKNQQKITIYRIENIHLARASRDRPGLETLVMIHAMRHTDFLELVPWVATKLFARET